MRMPILYVVTLAASLASSLLAGDATTVVIQDFEGDYKPLVWDKARDAVVSKEWKADGEKSLRIDPRVNTSFEDLKLKNWKGYSILRFHFNNKGKQTTRVEFTIFDAKGTDATAQPYWDWHISAFGVPPGEQTVDYDISSNLWRSETNSPYRGTHKTPIELDNIVKFSMTNGGDVLFLDKIELVKVKNLAVEGGFAFDFGAKGAPAMSQFIAIDQTTAYSKETRYGFLGSTLFKLGTSPSFPTLMLGTGLSFPKEGFRVDLPGGKYCAWIAFERGGFWGGEQSGYSQATLKFNGQSVHEHAFSPSGPHFMFQDTEVTDLARLIDQQIWPAHAVSKFNFTAAAGSNIFTLETTNPIGTPLRVAGLILAPDTAEGNAFIAEHEQLQRKAVSTVFPPLDRGRRGPGREKPAKPIVVQPLFPGEMVFPCDWPLNAEGAALPEQMAVSGQTITIHLGVYATSNFNVTVTAEPLNGDQGSISDISTSYGRYLPMRSTHNGAVWLDVSHYRPETQFTLGPDLARSLVVEYAIPADARTGNYSGAIRLTPNYGSALEIPIKLKVLNVKLEDIPIPVGLVWNALTFGPNLIDNATWWKLQEVVVKEQVQAGLNLLSGGPGLYYSVDAQGKISGNDVLRYVKMAEKYGPIKALLSQGGFLGSLRQLKCDYKTFVAGLKEFEEVNKLPPLFVYCYDEPATDAERLPHIKLLTEATQAGVRTLGYTSTHIGDQIWEKLVTNTYAPAFCIHSAKDIEWVKAAGRHFVAYNNGLDRYGMGLNLWRSIKLGVEARVNYIGMHMEGLGFYNLDAREPHLGCLMVHDKLGVLKTPQWLATREGLLDTRLRLTLEKLASKDDPVLKLWSVDEYRTDTAKWPLKEQERVRMAILKRIAELNKN